MYLDPNSENVGGHETPTFNKVLNIKSDDYEDRMCTKCKRLMKRQFPKPARPGSKDGSWGFGKENSK